MASWVGFTTTGLATFGVEPSASCAFTKLAYATWGILYRRLCLRRGCHHVLMPRNPSMGLSSWVRLCHVSHPVGYVSLKIAEKILLTQIFSPRLKPRTTFQVYDLSSCNILSDTNKFLLHAVLPLCLVLELRKTSSSGLEPRTFSDAVAFVSVISSSKQTILVLEPFYRE
jgi:hypothetical protein